MSWCVLSHSAKGTTWDKHMYLKVINGKYYYPDSYKGGRHLSSVTKTGTTTSTKKTNSGQELTMQRKLNVTKMTGTKITGKKKASQPVQQPAQPQLNPQVINDVSNQILKLFQNTMNKNPGSIIQNGKSPYTALRSKEPVRDGKTPETAILEQKPRVSKKRTAKTIIRQDSNGNEISRTVNGITQVVTKKNSTANLTPTQKAAVNTAISKAQKQTTSNSGGSSAAMATLISQLKKKVNK